MSEPIRIDVHIHQDQTHDEFQRHVICMLERIMHTLDETLAAVASETTADNSIIALLQGLQAQIAAGGLTPADQAKVDSIFTAATNNAAVVNAALATGVPPPAPIPAGTLVPRTGA